MARSWRDEDLILAVQISKSITEVLRNLGLRPAGGNHKSIKSSIVHLNLDISHFERPKPPGRKTIDLNVLFSENSPHGQSVLRRYVIKHKVLPYFCQICKRPPIWEGESMKLKLDHINGHPKDCRKENLRFICGNCDGQTETFARGGKLLERKFKRQNLTKLTCPTCEKDFWKQPNKVRQSQKLGMKMYCNRKCSIIGVSSQAVRVDRNKIIESFAEIGTYLGVAKIIGISDVAVKKALVHSGIVQLVRTQDFES